MVPSIELNSARNSIIKGPLNRAKLGLHVIINHPSIVLKYYCTTVLLSVPLLRAPAPEQLRPRPPQTTKDQRGGPPAIIIAWPELFGGGL